MTYARKVDENHAAIRDGLRAVFGAEAVQDVSMYAKLGFDLIAHARGRRIMATAINRTEVNR